MVPLDIHLLGDGVLYVIDTFSVLQQMQISVKLKDNKKEGKKS
jgi:hypothetical protein